MPSGGQNSKLFLCKMLLAGMGKGFTQSLGVVAFLEPWQKCLVSPTAAAGAAAEQGDHKLLSLLSREAAAEVGHCYNASTSLSSPGAEDSDSAL